MTTHDFDVYADETPTELHHKDCRDTPESYPTGDAKASAVEHPSQHAKRGESFDRSCTCLDPLLGTDRGRDTIYTCTDCGEPFTTPSDEFTTVAVSYHSDDREDFAESFCRSCADDLLDDLLAVVDP